MPFIFILFFPILEIYCINKVSDLIGGWETFWLIILISLIGMQLIRNQSFSSWTAYQKEVQNGGAPSQAPLKSVLGLVAGILLVIPGFITDIFAILLFFPLSQNLFVKIVTNYLKKKMKNGQFKVYTNTTTFNDAYERRYQEPFQEPYQEPKMKDVTPIKTNLLEK